MAVKEEIMNLPRARRTPLITCLFLLLFTFLGQAAWARIISLVYDDSGSMGHDGVSHLYANYATQVLAALLRADDDLRVVYMSQPNKDNQSEYPLTRGKRANTLDKIFQKYEPAADETPYSAVNTATNSLIQARNSAPAVLGAQDNDWLVVFTDGGFHKVTAFGGAKEHAEIFFQNPNVSGTRVIFLLIGDKADRNVALDWKNAALVPRQVTILPAPTGKELPGMMEQVARLINSRDEDQPDLDRQDSTISFTSPFPLGRITVLEQRQGGGKDFAVVKEALTPDGAAELEQYSVQTPGGGRMTGQVSHALGKGQVMRAGKYVLQFDRPIRSRALQVLLEPEVDFTVRVFHKNRELQPDPTTRKYNVCAGDELEFQVDFTSTDKGQIRPLPIAPNISMKVEGTLSGKQKAPVAFNPVQGYYRTTKPFKVVEGETRLSVEARYRGYIQKKVDAGAIIGDVCLKNVGAALTPRLEFPYTPEKDPQLAGKAQLVRTGENYQGTHTLGIPNLPKGVEVVVAGRTIKTPKDRIDITFELNKPLDVEVRTNRDFNVAGEVPLEFRLESDNEHARIPAATLTLAPQPRMLSLVGAPGRWERRLDELDKGDGPGFNFTAGGVPVPPDGLGDPGDYKFKVWMDRASGRIKVVDIAPSNNMQPGDYVLKLKQSRWFPFLTGHGDIHITLRAKGPFPGEETETTIPIFIEDIPWWQKYGPLAILVAVTAFALWWLNACRKKPRFGKRSHIDFEYIRNPGTTMQKPQRECTYYLAGWRARYDGNRLANFLLRWCWPFGPEKRRVEGVTFLAHRSKAQIVLPGNYLSQDMEINGLAPTDNDIRDRKDQFVHISLDISDRNGKTRSRYLYSAS